MKRSAALPRESSVPRLLSAAEGYDLAAGTYDAWAWSRFWDQVETPLVEAWLRSRPTGDVLDLGCGSGRYRGLIQELGNPYTGVDVSEKMLEENRRKHRNSARTTLINADIANVPLPDAAADSIICTRVLSHVRAPRRDFREIRRLLKPGGECFVSDIDPTHAYDYTHIPTPDGDVAIETHKHTWAALAKSIADIDGLTVARREVLTPQSLHSGATVQAAQRSQSRAQTVARHLRPAIRLIAIDSCFCVVSTAVGRDAVHHANPGVTGGDLARPDAKNCQHNSISAIVVFRTWLSYLVYS